MAYLLSKSARMSLWTLSGLLGVVGLITLALVLGKLRGPVGEYLAREEQVEELERKLSLGMMESQVREVLRHAPCREIYKASAPLDYYVYGAQRRVRAVNHMVQIYRCGYPVCYVWYDEAGLVEDFFVGGSGLLR